MAHYTEEVVPEELTDGHIKEGEFIAWLNEKLKENKKFCCQMRTVRAETAKAIFLVDDT